LKIDIERVKLNIGNRGGPRHKEIGEPIAECQGDREFWARVVRVENQNAGQERTSMKKEIGQC
jgi:hypothetical protein